MYGDVNEKDFKLTPLHYFFIVLAIIVMCSSVFAVTYYKRTCDSTVSEIRVAAENSSVHDSKAAVEFVQAMQQHYGKKLHMDFKYQNNGICTFYGSYGTKSFSFDLNYYR